MRALAIVVALAIPQVAVADWQTTVDTDCRCNRTFPTKPVTSTQPSPWPGIAWHRSEARISATEWYAVSYAVFDKVTPADAYTAPLAQVKGTIVTKSAVRGELDATIKRADGATIAIRIVASGRRVYALEVGDLGNAIKPDQLFAGFHAWTDKDAPPEGQVAGMTGTVSGSGGTLGDLNAPSAKGTVSLGTVTATTGNIEIAKARDMLQRGLRPLVDCFAEQSARATFTVTLDISRGGVSTPTVDGLAGNPGRCVHSAFDGAQIAKPTDGNRAKLVVTLTYQPTKSH